MEPKEIEFTTEYHLQGFMFPAGTRCRVFSGMALTLVERGQAKYIEVSEGKRGQRKLDNRANKSTEDTATIGS